MADGTTINGFSVAPPKGKRVGGKLKTEGQFALRIRVEDHRRLKALASREGLSLNQLGVHALNLALASYGEEPTLQMYSVGKTEAA